MEGASFRFVVSMVLDRAIDNEGTPALWWVNGRKGHSRRMRSARFSGACPLPPKATASRQHASCLTCRLASGSLTPAGLPQDVLSASGMRRSTLLELSGMELHEVAYVRRCFAGELAQGVCHAVVAPLP